MMGAYGWPKWADHDEQCPSRAAGLYHYSDPEGTGGTCAHCGINLRRRLKNVNVPERMRALGLTEKDRIDLVEEAQAPDEDDVPREYRHTTGEGPTGIADGPGRGQLTERQKVVLRFLHWSWVGGRLD